MRYIDNKEGAIVGVAILAVLGVGSATISYIDGIKSKNFNIVTSDNISKDSYIALVDDEIKLIQQGKVKEYDITEMTDRVKQYEKKHKHYLDLASKVQYVDTKECYINELVNETFTKKDDKGYQYKDIIIIDSLDGYLSEYDKILIENGKFDDNDMKELLKNISENEIVIEKINELKEDSPYTLNFKPKN